MASGHDTILGTKIHVAVDGNGLPVSIVMSPANIHDSAKFVDVIENISDYLDGSMAEEISTVCADKGYDAAYIRNF